MKTSTILFIACAIPIFGCGSGSSSGAYTPKPIKSVSPVAINPGEEASLFPATVDNMWQYQLTSSTVVGGKAVNQDTKYGFKIKSVTPIDGGNEVTLELLNEDVVLSTQVWRVTTTGIYQLSVQSGATKQSFVPAQLVAPFPLKIDADNPVKVPWKGTGTTGFGQSTIDSVTTTQGPVVVDTKAGQYSAYRFNTESKVTGPKGEQGTQITTSFFSPKVGLVKFMQTFKAENGARTEKLELLQVTVK